MLDCSGAPFKKFASLRDEWALKNCYTSPGLYSLVFHLFIHIMC